MTGSVNAWPRLCRHSLGCLDVSWWLDHRWKAIWTFGRPPDASWWVVWTLGRWPARIPTYGKQSLCVPICGDMSQQVDPFIHPQTCLMISILHHIPENRQTFVQESYLDVFSIPHPSFPDSVDSFFTLFSTVRSALALLLHLLCDNFVI